MIRVYQRSASIKARLLVQPAAGTTTLLHPSGERDMFTSVTDLRIMSSALALLITRAGKRVREKPENPEVIRARQLMDHVDDKLYLMAPCSMTPVKPPREPQSPKHV